MKQTTEEVLNRIIEKKKTHEAMKTGFETLDKFLDGGFFKGETIIMGAFTGVGKSQISGQIFHEIANQGYKSAYMSLEISNEMVLSRLIGAQINIKPTRLRYGRLEESEFHDKKTAESKIISLGDFVNFYDDVYRLEEIVKEIKTGEYEFVVVDFIQNVIERSQTEYTRLTNVAQKLQQVSRETNTCIMILSQLSNSVGREGSKAKNIEYKGSGAIATICDLGFFIERNRSVNVNDAYRKDKQEIVLTLMKNRRGVSGVQFKLIYQSPGGKIVEEF